MTFYYVHPLTGNDKANGRENYPWKTIQASVGRLKTGDTLYLASTDDTNPATAAVKHYVGGGILSKHFATVEDRTLIATEDGRQALIVGNDGDGNMLALDSKDHWAFKNVTMNARGMDRTSIMRFRDSTSNIYLENVRLEEVYGAGFQFTGQHKNIESLNCFVSQSAFSTTHNKAMESWSLPTGTGTIDGCLLQNFEVKSYGHMGGHVRGKNWVVRRALIQHGGGKAWGVGTTSGKEGEKYGATNILFDDCIMHRIGDMEEDVDDTKIAHGAFSIANKATGGYIEIRNCQMSYLDGAGINVDADVSANVKIYNNLIYGWQRDYAKANNYVTGAIRVHEKDWARGQSPSIEARNNVFVGMDFTPYVHPKAASRFWQVPANCADNIVSSHNSYSGDTGHVPAVKLGRESYDTLAEFVKTEPGSFLVTDQMLTTPPIDEVDKYGDLTPLPDSPLIGAGTPLHFHDMDAVNIGPVQEGEVSPPDKPDPPDNDYQKQIDDIKRSLRDAGASLTVAGDALRLAGEILRDDNG